MHQSTSFSGYTSLSLSINSSADFRSWTSSLKTIGRVGIIYQTPDYSKIINNKNFLGRLIYGVWSATSSEVARINKDIIH